MCKRLHSCFYLLFFVLLLFTPFSIFYVSKIGLLLFPKIYISRASVTPPNTHSWDSQTNVSHVSDEEKVIISKDVHRSHPPQPRSDRTAATLAQRSQLISNEHFTAINTAKEPAKTEQQRLSLLIYGADRSGTTFTTKMFAEDPQLFTVYEPLWITSLWNKEDPSQLTHWKRNIRDVLKGILSCKFASSQAGTKFLHHTQEQWSGAYFKNPFTSASFCNWTCQDLSKIPDYADKVCLSRYKHSVTKIGEPRMPDELLSTVVPDVFMDNPETDVRVIHLVRDPRASFNSRIKLKWMEDYYHWYFSYHARQQCSKLAQNIKFGRQLPDKWRDKFLEVNYENLAKYPIETTTNIYRFAGFEMPQSVKDWVVRNTSPRKEEILREREDPFSPVRNSSAVADQWRKESPIERIRIIEKHCEEVLDLLGLEKVA